MPGRRAVLFFAALFGVTLMLRLCHSQVLWADEDYHLAAGLQILRGKVLYRDIWYDKPPLAAWLYAAMGALGGAPLRVFGAAYVLAVCAAIWQFARNLWGPREAYLAAGLLAFFLNFDFAPAVIPAAPDLLLLLPAILSIYWAWRGRAFAAGLWSGVACLIHTKGLLPLAIAAVLCWRSLPLLALGFAVPNAATLGILAASGALPGYMAQVWQWGIAYARSSPEAHPVWNGFRRILDWSGFHAALLLGAATFGWRRWRDASFQASPEKARGYSWLALWLLLAFVAASVGGRFPPRYFLPLLPPLALIAANALARRPHAALAATAALALLVPLIRFAPRYFHLDGWQDLALDRDSHAVASILNLARRPGDTLFIWGYRPGIFVYTRMTAGSGFLDSQPLTGVPADRHLFSDAAVIPDWAGHSRASLAFSKPTFVVDSLSLSNPRLAIDTYPELHDWLGQYHLIGNTGLSQIYQRN